MTKTKILPRNRAAKKIRFLMGSVLAAVFSVNFLIIGIGGFFASSAMVPLGTNANFLSVPTAKAELFEKQTANNFVYGVDTLTDLRRIDYISFLGKPVKIPFESKNPDGVPGADRDYVIIFPPRILDKNASVPLRAIFFSSGKVISSEDTQFVKNIEQFVNSVGESNPVMLDIIKNLIENNMRMSLNNDVCDGNIACYVPTLLQIARAAEADTNPLLSTDDISQLTESLGDLDTTNPQVKQLLVLVLLLIMANQSIADSMNQEKAECLSMGGEWINETCESEEKTTCENNNGTFRKFTNQCLADKQFCSNDDVQCTNEKETDEDGNDVALYGCACKSGNCLDKDNNCVPKNNSKKKLCENSGGTWRSFYDSSELCLQKCGATESACINVADSSTSSSQGLMGCDCSNANTGSSDKWSAGTSNTAGKCLATSGSCIAKDTSKDDDDKDGVPNGQDRCPNSTPDGSGTVNMNLGSADAGCTCTQLQALGRIQKQQQQCPPDGCESGTPYMVKYDRSQQQNNQNQLCQNGIIQQQQQNNNNTTCPVISREPTDQCEREMERKNQNKNDNLQDMLKKMLDDKKKQDQNKKNQGDKNQSNNPGSNPGNNDPGQQQQPPPVTPPPPAGTASPATDPKGVGAYNAKQNGSNSQPYALHASQFKKICGENTYVLTNAKPGAGDFKDDPSKQTASAETSGKMPNPAADVDKLACPVGQTGSACGQNSRDGIKKIINENWSKLDEKYQKMVSDSIKNGPMLDQMKIDRIKDIINKAPKVAPQQAQNPVQNNNGKGAESMDKLNEPGAYFKIPKCEELAKTHCCICSCCDKKDDQCGWAIGEKCNNTGDKGTCEGDRCSKAKCDEKPELSIKINWGNNPNECSKNGDKEKTSQEKCAKYDKPTHEGACRYDCKGETKGCEEGSKECKIIIEGREIQRFNDERYDNLQIVPDPKAQFTQFTNKKDGSTIQTLGEKQPAETDWIKGLSKDKGVACKCQERDKNRKNPEDKPEGYTPPKTGDAQQQQPQQQIPMPEGDLNGAGQKPIQQPPQQQFPPVPPAPATQNPPDPVIKVPSDPSQPTTKYPPSAWPEPITEDGQNMRPGANPVANPAPPVTTPTVSGTQQVNNTWQSFKNTWQPIKNFIRELWNWGAFKHAEN